MAMSLRAKLCIFGLIFDSLTYVPGASISSINVYVISYIYHYGNNKNISRNINII